MTGTEIRIARIRAGLRQYELAQRTGIREPELSLIENNRKLVSPEKLARIVAVLPEVSRVRTN
jgi:transcriptional regulator with XRE-family HTH domain